MNQRGVSLVELLISMTILSVGLLAVVQMQIVSIQGSAAARRFSTATHLARLTLEEVKLPGAFLMASGVFINPYPHLENNNTGNDADTDFAPAIDKDTAIGSIGYDTIETIEEDRDAHTYNTVCEQPYPSTCSTSGQSVDYVRIINVKNYPSGAGTPSATVMKEVNVIILWKEGSWTRSISAKTLIGRKNFDFY